MVETTRQVQSGDPYDRFDEAINDPRLYAPHEVRRAEAQDFDALRHDPVPLFLGNEDLHYQPPPEYSGRSTGKNARGSRIVTGSRDHDSIVFDVATGAFLRLFPRVHGGTVTDAQFSPDSRWIATAGPRTVGLWSAATGRREQLLNGPESTLTAVGFTPDGRGIVTQEKNGDIRRADCVICGGVAELLPLARERLEATKRVLSDTERSLYVG